MASPTVMGAGTAGVLGLKQGAGGIGGGVVGAQTSRTISTLNTAQKQLVNFSVRAQNFILKKEL